MKQIVFFALFALVLAGVMPRVMSHVGKDQVLEARVQRADVPPAQQQANHRTVTVQGDRRGQYQVEGSVDGRRMDFIIDTGATVVALRERDAARIGIHPSAREYTASVSTANGIIKAAPVQLPSLEVGGLSLIHI